MTYENTDLTTSGRIFPSRFFVPVSESLEDIVTHTNPKSKRILSVAAYGYPLTFLSEGAKEVLSFDVDYSKISWNHFLRASLSALDYEENLAFLRCDRDKLNIDGVRDIENRVIPFIPIPFREEAIKYMWIFQLCYDFLADEITQIYPHVRDETTYRRVKETVNNGGWEILQNELLTLLEDVERSQSGRQFDVIYTSSIRNWVLDARYKADVQRFEEEYDRELGRLVSSHLDEDGVFYEVLIPAQGFPRVKISPRLYRGLNIQEYASQDAKSNTIIVVGKKLSVLEPTPLQ